MLDMMIAGFASVFTLHAIAIIIIGVVLGIVFGAIPGLTATMGVALCLPLTFTMGPIYGMALLIGIYIGGCSGGLIAAILLNIPGTPASIATTFDGHPMALRGEAGKALGIGIAYSFIGGLISILILIFISPPLADVALKFTPFEYFAITIFSLTMIASVSKESIIRGLMSGVLGISFALVGSAPIDAYPRFTLGLRDLDAGFSLLPVLIGLYAVSEILKTAENKHVLVDKDVAKFSKIRGFGFSLHEFFGQTGNMIRSSLIGTGIGILPGIGGSTSNIISYLTAKNSSKHPEEFGTGIMAGVVASETANNASVGGALIPLITLGIPGDTLTAMLLGGLMIHGLTPGPLLFATNGDIVYSIFASLIIANFAMLFLEYFGIRLFIRLLKIPKYILLPIVIVLCTVGSFGLNNRTFDVWAVVVFGLIGFSLSKFRFPLPPVILGFILGPILEINLRRGLMQSKGDFLPFLIRPIPAVFLLIAAASIVISVVRSRKPKTENAEASSE